MIEPKILLKKVLNFEDIIITHNKETNRLINNEIEKAALEKWDQLYKKSKQEGKLVWDSDYYRLDQLNILNKIIKLQLSTITFSLIKGHHELQKLYELDSKYFTNHISIGSIVKTKDNKFVFGIKSGKTLSSSNIDLIGGGVVKQEVEVNTGNDLYKMLLKEFQEELSLAIVDIEDTKVIGIIISAKMNIIIICFTDLNLTSKQLLNQFEINNDKEEINTILIINENKLIETLIQLGSYKILIPELIEPMLK